MKYFLVLAIFLATPVFGKDSRPSTYQIFEVGQKYNGLTFIGGINQGKLSNKSRESLYFVSNNKFPWKQASDICIDLLGTNASIISLETKAEAETVEAFLNSSGNPIRSYWTAGKYSTGSGVYIWPGGFQVEPTLWGAGEPSLNETHGRLVNMRMDSRGFKFHSRKEDDTHGFLCELIYGSSSEPVECVITNDLIIAVDSSGSISSPDFRIALEFANQVAAAWIGWKNDETTRTRIAFLVYSNHVETIFELDNKLDEFEMEDKILKAPHIDEGTASDLALAWSYSQIETFNRTTDKWPIPRNIVFLTDGQSNDRKLTLLEAMNLHNSRVRVFSVGVGNDVNKEELENIASDDTFVFNVNDFASLSHILKPLTLLLCDEGQV